MIGGNLTESERLELGLNLIKKLDRPDDTELRILICTATYFVLDGVTLTIRRSGIIIYIAFMMDYFLKGWSHI